MKFKDAYINILLSQDILVLVAAMLLNLQCFFWHGAVAILVVNFRFLGDNSFTH